MAYPQEDIKNIEEIMALQVESFKSQAAMERIKVSTAIAQ